VELPRLVQLYEEFEGRGVRFVSIDPGNRTPAASAFLHENGVRHDVLSDADQTVFEAYRVVAIPLTVLIDHEGRAVYRHVGFSPGDEDRLAQELEALIAWRGDAS
jgi:peroxiredoxin